MAYKIDQSADSKQDFFGILDYLTDNLFNLSAARSFNNELKACYNRLRNHPRMYPLVQTEPLASRGFRCAPVMRYTVFYTVNEGKKAVRIHRILHAAMDFTRQEMN